MSAWEFHTHDEWTTDERGGVDALCRVSVDMAGCGACTAVARDDDENVLAVTSVTVVHRRFRRPLQVACVVRQDGDVVWASRKRPRPSLVESQEQPNG